MQNRLSIFAKCTTFTLPHSNLLIYFTIIYYDFTAILSILISILWNTPFTIPEGICGHVHESILRSVLIKTSPKT
jgi:hypothetical protein